MDEELLAAAARAQAEFHRAVRRARLGGASVSDLATALEIGHQTASQIIEAAGAASGPRSHDRTMGQLECSFCGRRQTEVRKLVTGAGVRICDTCVGRADEANRTGRAVATALGRIQPVPDELAEWICSFCGKRRHKVAGLSVRIAEPVIVRQAPDDPSICTECVELCQEILAEELG